MKKIMRKLKSRSGETIGETLVALLISSLALVMLAAAITSASGIITRSSDKMDDYYEENENLIKMTGAESVSLTLSDGATGELSATISDVQISTNEILNSNKPVILFKKNKAGS